MADKISEKGIELIQSYEGFRRKAYLCSGGVWTIGWGHTAGVKEGDIITREQGDAWFVQDITIYEKRVIKDWGSDLPQNRFDALVSFYFNFGSMARSKNLRKYLKANMIPEAMRMWYLHYNADGKPNLGLKRRRTSEIIMFTGFPYTTWKEARTMDEPALVQTLVNIQEYLGGLNADK